MEPNYARVTLMLFFSFFSQPPPYASKDRSKAPLRDCSSSSKHDLVPRPHLGLWTDAHLARAIVSLSLFFFPTPYCPTLSGSTSFEGLSPTGYARYLQYLISSLTA